MFECTPRSQEVGGVGRAAETAAVADTPDVLVAEGDLGDVPSAEKVAVVWIDLYLLYPLAFFLAPVANLTLSRERKGYPSSAAQLS